MKPLRRSLIVLGAMSPLLTPAAQAHDYVGAFPATFRDDPQRQKASGFNVDEVFKNLSEGASR